MRLFVAFVCILTGWCTAAQATIIAVEYTGIYSGSWYGNFNPFTRELGNVDDPQSLVAGAFSVTFTFDTALATAPGQFDATHLSQIEQFPPPPPSVGWISEMTGIANYFDPVTGAGDFAIPGHTNQNAFEVGFSRYGPYNAVSLSLHADDPQIPGSILTPFTLVRDQPIGTGTYTVTDVFDYYGTAIITYDLSPLTLKVTVDGVSVAAVPEPSTWLLLLVGLAGVQLARKLRWRLLNATIASRCALYVEEYK